MRDHDSRHPQPYHVPTQILALHPGQREKSEKYLVTLGRFPVCAYCVGGTMQWLFRPKSQRPLFFLPLIKCDLTVGLAQ